MDLAELFPLSVDEESAGERIDTFLARQVAEVSRSRWSKLLDQKLITVDGQVASPATRLKAGQSIDCQVGEGAGLEIGFEKSIEEKPRFTGIEPDVIFEDDDLCVINKPVGLTVHPG